MTELTETPELPSESPSYAPEPDTGSKNKSGSAIIMDYIQRMHEQGYPTLTVLSTELARNLDVSQGAVSGFLSRLVASGAAKIDRKNGLSYVYQIDVPAAVAVHARDVKSVGSVVGRQDTKRTRRFTGKSEPAPKALDRTGITELLWQAIQGVTDLHEPIDLTQISTEALLEELKRRTTK